MVYIVLIKANGDLEMATRKSNPKGIKKGYSFIHPEHGLSWITDTAPCGYEAYTCQKEDGSYIYYETFDNINEYPEGDSHKIWLQDCGWVHAVKVGTLVAGVKQYFNSGSSAVIQAVRNVTRTKVEIDYGKYQSKRSRNTFVAVER